MFTQLFHSINRCLDQLLAPRCWLCEGDAQHGRDLCAACFRELPWLGSGVCPVCAMPMPSPGRCGACLQRPGPIHHTRAALRYQDDARELVHGYKFGQDLVAGRVLAQALLSEVSIHLHSTTLIPIPSTDRRLRHRGFDPATEIARYLCAHLPRVTLLHGLARRDQHAPQSIQSSRKSRQINVRDVFHVKHPQACAVTPCVTLVDDVLTSGATANAAASALLRAGFQHINLWVCARTP